MKRYILDLINLGRNRNEVLYSAEKLYLSLKLHFENKYMNNILYPIQLKEDGRFYNMTFQDKVDYRNTMKYVISNYKIIIFILNFILQGIQLF
jgi:hypothetical protein